MAFTVQMRSLHCRPRSLRVPCVIRKPGALAFLPSEDEWYKAAYYKGGGTNAGYWDYPTQSDNAPAAEAPPGTNTTNGSANYGWAVGDLTDVGAYTYKPSDSAYDTLDQGGNVMGVERSGHLRRGL